MPRKLLVRFLKILLAGFLIIASHVSIAQSQCQATGVVVSNQTEFGTIAYATGDVFVAPSAANPADPNSADWMLLSQANVTVFAAVSINVGAVVRLKAGSRLTIYGDFTNRGYLFVEPGATITFYGRTWKNIAGSVVGDGFVNANLSPGGDVIFESPRPLIPASLNAHPCLMINYSGGNFSQYVDCGGVSMDVSLHIDNPHNLQVVNTNLVIEGNLVFDIVGGDLVLGDNNVIFTLNGSFYWTIPNANDAYIITNGTKVCSGYVMKLMLPNSNFVFPLGKADGLAADRDFNPAVVRNDGHFVDTFKVFLHDYVEAFAMGAQIPYAPLPGWDRVWQVRNTMKSQMTVDFAHKVGALGTNPDLFFTSGMPLAIKQMDEFGVFKKIKGPKTIGGGTSGIPSVVSNDPNGYEPDSTADACNAPLSLYLEAPEYDTSLNLKLSVSASECAASLKIISDSNVNLGQMKLIVERKTISPPANNFTFMGEPALSEEKDFALFTDRRTINGENLYRIKAILADGTIKYSNIAAISFACTDIERIVFFPNPVTNKLYIENLEPGDIVNIFLPNGQKLNTKFVLENDCLVDMFSYPSQTYILVIVRKSKQILSKKIIKL